MPIAVDDLVRSVGRIKTMQGGSPRHIEFGLAKVVDVGDLITVNPVGKNAILLCRPEDLEVVEPASDTVPDEPEREFAAGGVIPAVSEVAVPEGIVIMSGDVAEEQPKPKVKPRTLKEKREAEDKADDKPKKAKPRRRRR
jgi:hypothetical protein